MLIWELRINICSGSKCLLYYDNLKWNRYVVRFENQKKLCQQYLRTCSCQIIFYQTPLVYKHLDWFDWTNFFFFRKNSLKLFEGLQVFKVMTSFPALVLLITKHEQYLMIFQKNTHKSVSFYSLVHYHTIYVSKIANQDLRFVLRIYWCT